MNQEENPFFDKQKYKERDEKEKQEHEGFALKDHTPVYNSDGSLDIEATLASTGTEAKRKANLPKCPTCGSIDIKQIGTLEKAASVGMFGIFSNKRKYQFKCKNCGYMW